jgi:phosphoglycerate dehydrogenase-like enzyme
MKNELGSSCNFIDTEDYTEAGLLNAAKDADIFLGSFVTENLIKTAKDLKLIQIPWTGVENLNYEVLSRFNIPVCNSHSNSRCVGEYAFSMLMSLIKKIPYHDRLMRGGNWNRPQKNVVPEYDNFSDTLHGKTVAFLGYGEIARKIVEYLKPFNCKILAIANYDNHKKFEELEFKGTPDDLEYVLSEADIVFVTLPYTESTRNLIDSDRIDKMKSTSYIVNIARGAIVNEMALYNALKEKRIAGAAIDVWYKNAGEGLNELPSDNFPFHELSNIVISPHRAGFSMEKLPHLDDAIENIKRLSAGIELINKINISKKY